MASLPVIIISIVITISMANNWFSWHNVQRLQGHVTKDESRDSICRRAVCQTDKNLRTQPYIMGLPQWCSGVSHSLQCAWPLWPPGSRGLGSLPGSSGLSVHADQLSAYSEINISGRHTGSTCVLVNLWQAIRTRCKGGQTSSAS